VNWTTERMKIDQSRNLESDCPSGGDMAVFFCQSLDLFPAFHIPKQANKENQPPP